MLPPPPTPAPPPPTPDDPAAKEAARKEAVLNAGLMGRGATLLFGGSQTDPQRRGSQLMMGTGGAMGSGA
jgi:hypothetical protein